MESAHSIAMNRSTTCFFCLRPNSRKYLNPQSESHLFCGDDAEGAVSSFHEFSLRNLYRFLNLLQSDKEKRDFSDLKMPICEKCFKLNGEFNKLYNQLEEIKLRLNWCVQKMQDVMTNAGKGMEMEDGNNENKMEVLRAHTFDRMTAFTLSSLPRVVLYKNKKRKLTISDDHDPVKAFECHEVFKMETDNGEVTIANSGGLKIAKLALALPERPQAPLSPLSIDEHPVPDHKVKKEQEILSPSAPDMAQDDQLKAEMLCDAEDLGLHLETSSPEVKAESVTHDISTSRDEYPTLTSNLVTFSTNKIRVRFGSSKRILNQSTTFALSNNKFQRPTISMKRRRSTKCSYCPFVCDTVNFGHGRWSMVRHQVRFHPEHFLLDENERDQASGFQPERFRKILTDIVFPKLSKRIGSHASCSVCGITYKCRKFNQNYISVRQHLIFHHKIRLKETLKIALEDPLLDESLSSTSSSPESRKILALSFPRTKYFWSCTYCSFNCAPGDGASTKIARHLARFHPEHFLLDENERDQASGFNPELFRRIVNEVVLPKFTRNPTGHHTTSCSLCGVIYKCSKLRDNISAIREHLIFRHETELKEDIRIFMQDPLWEEKLSQDQNSGIKFPNTVPTISYKYNTTCTYCGFKCTSPPGISNAMCDAMVNHLVEFHPEHYLIDEREGDKELGGLGHEDYDKFKRILTEIVYPDFIANVSGVGPHRSCPLCGIVFKGCKASTNVLSMKRHLLLHHKMELVEKLKVILKDPLLLEEGLRKTKKKKDKSFEDKADNLKVNSNFVSLPAPNVKPKSSRQCIYCRFKCNSIGTLEHSMERHLIRFHPEHFLYEEEERLRRLHPQFQKILAVFIFPKYLHNSHPTTCRVFIVRNEVFDW